jgi:hypothetical protein
LEHLSDKSSTSCLADETSGLPLSLDSNWPLPALYQACCPLLTAQNARPRVLMTQKAYKTAPWNKQTENLMKK